MLFDLVAPFAVGLSEIIAAYIIRRGYWLQMSRIATQGRRAATCHMVEGERPVNWPYE